MVNIPLWAWALFLAIVIVMLFLDLAVLHRKAHAVKMREAVKWSIMWITLGLSFTVIVYWLYLTQSTGTPAEQQEAANVAVQTYLTGFVLEKALSVDNLFVFVVLLSFFGVKPEHQHRVLFYGILGALLMRGAFIFAGTAAIAAYKPTLYFFGGLLIYTAIKMAYMGEEEFKPSDSRIYRWLKRVLPLTDKPHLGHFFHSENGKRLGTSLLLCLFMVEMTDVLFALDSVPAVMGITQDPFIVYTSNVFAILGLRALYFVIVGGLATLRFLKPALVLVLLFIGLKMILLGPHVDPLPFPLVDLDEGLEVSLSLAIVIGILGVAILASWMYEKHRKGSEKVEELGRKMAEETERAPDPDAPRPEGDAKSASPETPVAATPEVAKSSVPVESPGASEQIRK
ncbi:MAG TPA: TerC family protein [Thermoplasmata archaeon]|nr:TerC family protein [Thermoplasmata archaeon]